MNDIIERLRRWSHERHAQPASDLMDEAAGEIEKLRSLTRFQDSVIRSGDVAALTDSERRTLEGLLARFPVEKTT